MLPLMVLFVKQQVKMQLILSCDFFQIDIYSYKAFKIFLISL